MKNKKTAFIIGAGPAGLTAAYELLERTDIIPIVLETTSDIGGISKTVHFKGNLIDIGGHRFYSKSDRVNQWWLNILPLQDRTLPQQTGNDNCGAAVKREAIDSIPDREAPAAQDKVMLLKERLSRILFRGSLFDYPLRLTTEEIRKLGIACAVKIGLSYSFAKLFPIKPERTLEDFLINRFGKELYGMFFSAYTEKVWGVSCRQISADWGAQRIKTLSLLRAISAYFKSIKQEELDIAQKDRDTSLIERFMYPLYGPGQMWEETARLIRQKGGVILTNHTAVGFKPNDNSSFEVTYQDRKTGLINKQCSDYLFSSMPVSHLIDAFEGPVSTEVYRVASGLEHRDFIIIGLLLKHIKLGNSSKGSHAASHPPDHWIYIQEEFVKVGRIQFYNNWSPYLVKDPNTTWIGMEYFCSEGDTLWSKTDETLISMALEELKKMGGCTDQDVLDATVLRMTKAYPAYWGTYNEFNVVRNFVDQFENLFLIGRNGMHRYNNQDHSMLTAMYSVDNIIAGKKDKDNIWSVNSEHEYLSNTRSSGTSG